MEPKRTPNPLEHLTEQELQDLKDAYPSASAGPHDNLADAVDARLAELREMSI